MLFLVIGFICLSDENKFMLIISVAIFQIEVYMHVYVYMYVFCLKY